MVANGTRACLAGSCAIGACSPGFANCDGMTANGCEVAVGSDVNNCGACGLACALVANGTRACQNSQCAVGACNPGFANCNNAMADGCEVNLASSPTNCGACGNVCPGAAPNCVASACVP